MCETKFLPAADGTSCGRGMVGRHIYQDFTKVEKKKTVHTFLRAIIITLLSLSDITF
jgi:hypothetical protein